MVYKRNGIIRFVKNIVGQNDEFISKKLFEDTVQSLDIRMTEDEMHFSVRFVY